MAVGGRRRCRDGQQCRGREREGRHECARRDQIHAVRVIALSSVRSDFAVLKLRCAKLAPMGIYFRKRKKTGKNSWINVSGSGASMSTKVGPVTFNSRGGMWVNLPGGLNFRGRWR